MVPGVAFRKHRSEVAFAPRFYPRRQTRTRRCRSSSSQYLLDRLNVSPNSEPPLLGDAYFETKYVQQQVLDATGAGYLSPSYTTPQQQEQALLNNAVSEAGTLGLQVGVALTQAQVAALTQDIVWDVPEVVNGETVLVPQLYLAAGDAAKVESGASEIAASNVSLSAANIANTGGVIAASNNLDLAATGSIVNTEGTLSAGGDLTLTAGADIANIGGTISAGGDALLSAAGSITSQSLTGSWQSGGSSATVLTEAASITAGGNLTAIAGTDIQGLGSLFSAGGTLSLAAANDVSLGAVALASASSGSNASSSRTEEVGTTLSAGGDLSVVAGNDITASASTLGALGSLSLGAGNDITLQSLVNSSDSENSGHKSGFFSSKSWINIDNTQTLAATSLSATGAITVDAGQNLTLAAADVTSSAGAVDLGAGNDVTLDTVALTDESLHQESKSSFDIISSSASSTKNADQTVTQAGASVSGASVLIAAGNDLSLTGASVVGTNDVSLAAGGDLTIQNATDTEATDNTHSSTTSGLFSGGGLTLTLGQESESFTATAHQTSVSASTIGSVSGDLSVTAGGDLTVTGSDLISGADMSLSASSIDLGAAYQTLAETETEKQSSAGLSLGLGGSVGSALNGIASATEAATSASDGRLAALEGVQAGYLAYQNSGLPGSSAASSPGQASLTLDLTLGASSSSATETTAESIARGSTATAGGTLTATASNGDLTATGATLTAQTIDLAATGNVTLDAASSTSSNTSSNHASSGSIGVAIGATGVSLIASAAEANGSGTGSAVTNTNTTVTAGQGLTITAGQDVTLAGATASGNQILLDAGRDLNLSSLQDTELYSGKQQSESGSLSIPIAGAGAAGGSISAGRTTIASTYASVGQQTGLYAGTGGFDITVGGNTNLTGAVIASAGTSNTLSTGTLSFSNIQNQASYNATTTGISLSSAAPLASAAASGVSGLGLGGQSGSASGVTQSAIAATASIIVRNAAAGTDPTAGLSRDTANANGAIQQIFNLESVENNMAVGQLAGQVGMEIAGSVADNLESNSKDPVWGTNGIGRDALHAAVSAIAAGISGGNAGAAVAGTVAGDAASGLVSTAIQQATSGLPPALAQTVANLATNIVASAAGAAAGAATGGNVAALTGAQGASNSNLFNTQSHPQASSPGDQVAQADEDIKPAENNNNDPNAEAENAMDPGSNIGGLDYSSDANNKPATGFDPDAPYALPSLAPNNPTSNTTPSATTYPETAQQAVSASQLFSSSPSVNTTASAQTSLQAPSAGNGLSVGSGLSGDGGFATSGALSFSQSTASPFFSAEGNFAGQSIADVAGQLRDGSLEAGDVPVQAVSIDGSQLIVNTRSALSLMQAGIPQSNWNIIDMTGNSNTEAQIMQRLSNNGLSSSGTSTLRITGSGANASTLIPGQ